jgi:ketosteroid isomerase-like protein
MAERNGTSRALGADLEEADPLAETVAVTLVREAFEAFARRDLAALVDLTDPEVELFAPTGLLANEGRCYRGHDGIARYLYDVDRVWARLDVVPEKFREVGNHVVATGRVRAQARDGLEVDNPAAWVWELRGGRLCWGCVYDDPGETFTGAAHGIESPVPAFQGVDGDLPRPVGAA